MAAPVKSDVDFPDVLFEMRGAMTKGRLKLTDTHLVFKSSKTGKVEQVLAQDIETAHWLRFACNFGLRIFTKMGTLVRFAGFKEPEKERLSKHLSSRYNIPLLDKEQCIKGWNWGVAKFSGSVLSFDAANMHAFDIPLSYVSQCTTAKNEVTLEFHQNDDVPVSLMELRFHMPSSEVAGDTDPVDAFKDQVLNKADIISAVGDAVAIFREVQCLTPRGRYDIKVFTSFFQLHGKTFDYKIPMSTVLRLFLLPHKDNRQTFFVVSLDPPIKQGQTRYHFLVFLFSGQEEDITIELPFSDAELKTKYDGKLTQEMSGPMYEILSKVMKAMVNRKITQATSFVGHSGTPAVGCSYKAAAGYMYPCDRGFIYVHKPPIHIRFEEISSVNFARSGGSTRSFDFEVETKTGLVHTFNSIEKEEYPKLFDFITTKKLRVKNSGKMDKPGYLGDFDNSDAEEEPDAYLARVKAEAQERSENDMSDSEGSEDVDYNPENVPSDVAEEFDSNPSSSSESDSGAEGSDADRRRAEKKERKEKKKKSSKPKERSGAPRERREKRSKKTKDKNAPKRPSSAFMLFFNANREKIKAKNPSMSITDISKKAGEMWKDVSAKEKAEYDDKYQELKKEYKKAMENYVPEKDGSPGPSDKSAKKRKKPSSSGSKSSGKGKDEARTSSGGKDGSGTGFKSKEFIDSSGSSSDSDGGKDKAKPSTSKKVPVKKEKSASPSASPSASGSGSGSASD